MPGQSAVIECNWLQPTFCSIYNITPDTQQNEVFTVNGKPSNYINTDTEELIFDNHPLSYFPSGAFNVFTNVIITTISGSPITTLTTNLIVNCASLQYFRLTNGKFTNIPAGILESCSGLRQLFISNGDVKTIDVNAFRGLGSVTNLDLHTNKINCVPLGLFDNMPSLDSINLMDNQLSKIDSNIIFNNPTLTSLTLSKNLLTFIPFFNISSSSTNSLAIDVDMNLIAAVSPNLCSTFNGRPADSISISFSTLNCLPATSKLTLLSTSSCASAAAELQACYGNWTASMAGVVDCSISLITSTTTTTVQPTTVPATTSVATTASPTPGSCPSDKICRYFLDQYNRYTCILDGVDSVLTSISGNHVITFSDLNVRRVVFTNSFLPRIPPILFQKFTNLEYLTVSNCSINAINLNTFTACGNLKYFDASNNFITTIDGASFKSCAALEIIDLSGNKIDFVNGQLFANNPNLKSLYINRPPAMVLV